MASVLVWSGWWLQALAWWLVPVPVPVPVGEPERERERALGPVLVAGQEKVQRSTWQGQ